MHVCTLAIRSIIFESKGSSIELRRLLDMTQKVQRHQRPNQEMCYKVVQRTLFCCFSGGTSVTAEDCKEVLASPSVDSAPDQIYDSAGNDSLASLADLTINCKLTHEILPKWLNQLQSCKEDFPPYGRLVYSSSSMIIQYLLPTITISIAYYQIYGQLKIRLNQKMRQLEINATPAVNGGPARSTSANANLIDRIENDIHRMRRTIHLLISMGLVFCICWLPLNILNTVS